MLVPILSVILLFVWGFGSSVNPNKKNFARAMLIGKNTLYGLGLPAALLFFSWIFQVEARLYKNRYGEIFIAKNNSVVTAVDGWYNNRRSKQ